MTGLSWMFLTTALLLLAGDSGSAVDQNLLANIIKEIQTDYDPKRMFSIAVSIPRTNNQYSFNQVLSKDNGAQVQNTMRSGAVYRVGRIVAAMFLQKKGKRGEDTHAEYRVLQNLDSLLNNNDINFQNDLLIFYVFGSPCYQKCAMPGGSANIIDYLPLIRKWTSYAFVFTDIFESKNPQFATTVEQRKTAIENLANVGGLGLNNIFRCEDTNNAMACRSCSQNNQVAQYCISDKNDDISLQPFSGSSRGTSFSKMSKSPPSRSRSWDNSHSQKSKGQPDRSRSRINSSSQIIKGRQKSKSPDK